MNHIVSIAQFDRKRFDRVFLLALHLRLIEEGQREPKIPVSELLKGTRVGLLHVRRMNETHLVGFQKAAQSLGAKVRPAFARDSGQMLSVLRKMRGENVDAVVLNHPDQEQLLELMEKAPLPIIKAGDPNGAQPLKAIVELKTLLDLGVPTKFFRVVLTGDFETLDLAAFVTALAAYKEAGLTYDFQLVFCAPKSRHPSESDIAWMAENNFRWRATTSIEDALSAAEAVYQGPVLESENPLVFVTPEDVRRFAKNPDDLAVFLPKSWPQGHVNPWKSVDLPGCVFTDNEALTYRLTQALLLHTLKPDWPHPE